MGYVYAILAVATVVGVAVAAITVATRRLSRSRWTLVTAPDPNYGMVKCPEKRCVDGIVTIHSHIGMVSVHRVECYTCRGTGHVMARKKYDVQEKH